MDTADLLARRGEVLKNSSYRNELGVDSRRATSELRDLVERGLIVGQGVKGGATYHISSAPAALPEQLSLDLQDAVWEALVEPRTRRELEDITGLPPHTVIYRLRKLRNHGLVEQTGAPRSRAARWRRV